MLEILKYPDPRLKQVSTPVENFDASLHELLDGMAKAMYQFNGIGLAAPQVNHFLRAFIIDISEHSEEHKGVLEFINPVFSNGAGTIDFEEGCLSIPGITEYVRRKETITIDFQDRDGEKHRLDAEGLLAVATQHENDHLDGILFVDRISAIKRQLIKRKIKKALTF